MLEQVLHEGSGTALTKPLRTQLQADRERRMARRRKEVIVPSRLSSLLSPTPSVGSRTMVTVPSTELSKTIVDVVASSSVPTLSAQAPSALQSGSPGAPSIQLEATEDEPFAHEMRTASISSTATRTTKTESGKKTSAVPIPPEAKEPKRRGRPRKEQQN